MGTAKRPMTIPPHVAVQAGNDGSMEERSRDAMLPVEGRCRQGASVQVDLPPLDPEQAVKLITVLEKVIEAIWWTHGDAMADYLGCVAPDSMPRPADAVWCGDPDADSDLDF